MARELMNCRHELDASKRVQSEYAERTHAAEKAAARAREAMHEAKRSNAGLVERYEKMEREVQEQRDRVTRLRVSLHRAGRREFQREEAGAEDAGYGSDPGSGQRRAGSTLMMVEDRPDWNFDTSVTTTSPPMKRTLHPASSHILLNPHSITATPPPGVSPHSSAPGAANAVPPKLHLNIPPRDEGGSCLDSPRSSVAGGDSPRVSREVYELKHQLGFAKAEKAAAERAAEDRQSQCEKMQALVADADHRRDEQAEAAAEACAEASALRRQLQSALERVNDLMDEKNELTDTTHEQVLDARTETATAARVLASELNALEELCSLNELAREDLAVLGAHQGRRRSSLAASGIRLNTRRSSVQPAAATSGRGR